MCKSSYFKLFNDDLIEKLSFEKRQLLRHRNDLQSAFVFKFVSSPVSSVHPGWLLQLFSSSRRWANWWTIVETNLDPRLVFFYCPQWISLPAYFVLLPWKGMCFLIVQRVTRIKQISKRDDYISITSIITSIKTIDLTFLFLCKYSQIYF